jgi:hypothetical protein
MHRSFAKLAGYALAACVSLVPLQAQINLEGVWGWINQEDSPDRGAGPELGDFGGIPINAANRDRALAWSASLIALPEYQCRVHPSDYASSFADFRMWFEIDRESQSLVAVHMHHFAWGTERTIWMDGRPHPPEYAPHTSMGFSTGVWEGDTLRVRTTHLKEGWIRRNGVARSDLATISERFTRHGNRLMWTLITYDPTYFTEPFIRNRDFNLQTGIATPAYPCESVVETVHEKGYIPHYLPGENNDVKEYSSAHQIPQEAAMGGAETMYPEYLKKVKTLPAPPPAPPAAKPAKARP